MAVNSRLPGLYKLSPGERLDAAIRASGVSAEDLGNLARPAEDILTIAVHGCVHVVKVLGEAERRGPPVAARLLYVEMAANPHDGAAQKQDASTPPVC